MHEVLSDPYRCAVLYYLEQSEEPADVRELTEQVLSWCRDGGRPDEDAVLEREDGAIELDGHGGVDLAREWLLESHVLSMERFGLVAYDRERDAVALSDDATVTITPHWEE